MAEWLNAAPSKRVIRVTESGVRISLSPIYNDRLVSIFLLLIESQSQDSDQNRSRRSDE